MTQRTGTGHTDPSISGLFMLSLDQWKKQCGRQRTGTSARRVFKSSGGLSIRDFFIRSHHPSYRLPPKLRSVTIHFLVARGSPVPRPSPSSYQSDPNRVPFEPWRRRHLSKYPVPEVAQKVVASDLLARSLCWSVLSVEYRGATSKS